MNIFDYWFVWDWLASEPFTDGLSLLSGYVAFCVTIVTVLIASIPVLRFARWYGNYEDIRTVVIWTAVLLAVLAATLVTFGVHDLCNQYQAWYSTPLGPSL